MMPNLYIAYSLFTPLSSSILSLFFHFPFYIRLLDLDCLFYRSYFLHPYLLEFAASLKLFLVTRLLLLTSARGVPIYHLTVLIFTTSLSLFAVPRWPFWPLKILSFSLSIGLNSLRSLGTNLPAYQPPPSAVNVSKSSDFQHRAAMNSQQSNIQWAFSATTRDSTRQKCM